MATYQMVQDRVKAEAGFVPQTCWIAEVKAAHGLVGEHPPSLIDPHGRLKTCPNDKRPAIEAALLHFRLL